MIPTARATDDLSSGHVLIVDGVITAVAPSLPDARATADDIIDATGKIVIPGLIDTIATPGRRSPAASCPTAT